MPDVTKLETGATMTEVADCRCETILSPQMEYKPGPHHDPDCPMRRPPLDEGSLVDTEESR